MKAAIFDLDGTLSYTLDSIAISGNKALMAIGLAPYETERFKYFCGDGPDEIVRRMLFYRGDTEYTRYDELRPIYGELFRQNAEYKVRPYDGMPQALEAMKQRGLKLAVLSNKPHPQTIQVVTKLYGENLFDYIQGNTPEIPRKPAPDGALLVANQLAVKPNECLYIGDTDTDMQTGNAAGMYTCGALWGYRTREELEKNNAKVIVNTPSDLLSLVS